MRVGGPSFVRAILYLGNDHPETRPYFRPAGRPGSRHPAVRWIRRGCGSCERSSRFNEWKSPPGTETGRKHGVNPAS